MVENGFNTRGQKLKAFVGHSFDDKDSNLVDKVIKFLESTDITCETGERAQNKSVAEKVKGKILNNDIFVGLFTRDKKIDLPKSERKKGQEFYTTSNWVIQESGFAIGHGKELILLVENGVYKFPELQSDLEFILFDRSCLDELFLKLSEMVNSIQKEKAKGVPGVEVQEKGGELGKQEVEKEIEEKKEEQFVKFTDAILKDKDAEKAKEIYDTELEKALQMKKGPIGELLH